MDSVSHLPTPIMGNHNGVLESGMFKESHQSAHMQLKADCTSLHNFIAPPVAQPVQSVNFVALPNQRRKDLYTNEELEDINQRLKICMSERPGIPFSRFDSRSDSRAEREYSF